MSNVISVSGNLVRDAELKQDKQGRSRLQFSLADNVGYGERQHTNWFNCILWGARGEALKQHMVKGKEITVHGEMKLDEYTSPEGEVKKSLSLNAQNIVLHKGGGGGSSSEPSKRKDDDDDWML